MAGISFTQIPSDLRVPGQYFEIDNSRGGSKGTGYKKRILVLGQRLTSGTGTALVPTLIQSVSQVAGEAGYGSHLHNVVAALRNANRYTEAWYVAIADDGAGVAATKTVTITGPATGAGTIALYIGGVQVLTGVASGDAATAIATNLAAAINAVSILPFTAAAVGAVVTLTCRHKGAWGNDHDVRLNYYAGDVLPLGVGVTIATGVSGTTNPSIAAAIAALGDQVFTHWVMPWNDAANMALLNTELERRWGGTVMKEGLGFTAVPGSLATVTTWGTSHNYKLICAMDAGLSPTPPYVFAAATAGVDAFEPIPNRPRQTLLLPGCLPPKQGLERRMDEANILLHDGIATFMVDSGGNCLIQRLVTNYQLNAWGIADDSYLDIEKMTLLITLRFERRKRIAQRFPRCRLVKNGSRVQAGSDIITLNDIRDDAFAQARDWVEYGWIQDDMTAFKNGYRNEIPDSDPNRVNEVIPPDCVGGLRVFAGLIQFLN